MTKKSDIAAETDAYLMLGLLEGFIYLDQQLQQALKQRNMPSVGRTASMLMVYIASGVNRPSDLAKKLGITRQSINSAIRDLEQKSLITLEVDPADARCKIVKPAAEAQEVHLAALAIVKDLESRLAEKIGRDKLRLLKQILAEDWAA